MRKRFVLDTNCIIDLEENRPNAVWLCKLVDAWRSGRIDLAVVAVSASENQTDGSGGRDYSAFEAKLDLAGLAGIHVLLPLLRWDVSLWDHALWPSDEMNELATRVHQTLFPASSEASPADAASIPKWRNKLCDAAIAWSCIYHDWRSLVTRDKNFHHRAAALRELGLAEICYPADAVGLCADI